MLVELSARVSRLKQERGALILAHNYQPPEIQDIADYTGDSLELSIKAAEAVSGLVVFCGVRFMAETAKILSPRARILLPAAEAGCPMADMIGAEELRDLKGAHPGALVVCYVNSTAEVKAESDIAVTSANAAKIVEGLPDDRPIIFVPDENLGRYVEARTGRRLILTVGYCPTHARITPEAIGARRAEYPDGVVLVHPECPPDTIAAADAVLSTGGMCAFVRSSPASTFIIATELGIIHRLKKENPNPVYVPVTADVICPNMKLTTLEDVAAALETLGPEIALDEKVRARAELPIRRMLAGGLA